MTETDDLVDLVVSTDELDSALTERSIRAVRDWIGAAIRGATGDTGDVLRAYAMASPADGSAMTFDGTTAGPERACLLNGAFGHTLDFDDTFSAFPLHPTTVVTPAALSAGELADADGEAFLRAYAVGVEVLHRVGKSVFPTQYGRGFHSTAAVGPIGAAATAAVVLDLDEDELRNAIGIAASSAGGLRKNFGTTTKPLHAGFAASAGLRAALLAREGATAHENALGGESGYGEAMAGEAFDPSELVGDELSGVADIALKLFASAHITHGSMEALRRLRERERLSPESVASMTATMHPGGREVLIHSDPDDALEAKFSIEFCLAAVLRSGKAGLEEFTDEYVTAPETRETMETVEAVYDEAAIEGLGRYGGRVTVETTDGETFEAAAAAPGSPDNPASESRLRGKFDSCVAPTSVDAEPLAAAIEGLAEGGSVSDVFDAL
ncbi:MmgE/PrpD family protein [Natronomonas salsuginis]|uniref:MmgE/PrpD family protein n=1 Tax=Natronomonas salsuginis TaxID=2217661 RepID=A0A4U5JC59_9EURY|nr:MmgE/PrpD family protein [Natronomonas salsuginis]TKR26205.1 MmgE/PrpD family protein [Natronomonas salsuginis]